MGEPPRLTLQLEAAAGTATAVRVAWSAAGTRTYVRKGVLDGWSCEGAYTGSDLVISNLVLRSERGAATASARWMPEAHTIDLDARSDLPAAHTLALLPAAVRDRLAARGLAQVAGLQLALSATNAPLSAWARHPPGISSGRIDVLEGDSLARCTGGVRDASGGRPDRPAPGSQWAGGLAKGPWPGSWESDWEHRYRAQLDIGFGSPLGPALARRPRSRISSCASTSRGTRRARRSRSAARPHREGGLALNGALTGSDFSYNGVTATQFATSLAYSNEVLTFRDWKLQRPEGTLAGWLVLDFAADAEELDMASTIDPEAVKQLIGPVFAKNLRIARFAGPAAISARGRVVQGGPGTRLQVDIESGDTALEWFRCDRVSLQLGVEDDTYRFTNIVAQAYGGSLTGRVTLLVPSNAPPSYEISGAATGIALRALLLAIRPGETGFPSGTLSGDVALAGVVGPGQGSNVTGRGTVLVREGQLFRLKVLGGLSSMISAIAPGWGYASQTDFRSDFELRRGRCEMQNAMLEGSIVSVRVTGAYYFDQRVKFVVEVKPLRGGAVATVLRWLTSPVTRLFKFSLSGTLADPKWRPENLPKELFLIFD
jgi:hypothetical protein